MKKRTFAVYFVVILVIIVGVVSLYLFLKFQKSESEIKKLVQYKNKQKLTAEQIIKLIKDKDIKKRFQALKQIKKLSDQEKKNLFLPMLNSNDKLLKTTAVRNLLLLNDNEVNKKLLELYKNEKDPIIKNMIKEKLAPDQGSELDKNDAENVVKEPKKEEKSKTEKSSENIIKKEVKADSKKLEKKKEIPANREEKKIKNMEEQKDKTGGTK